MRKRFVLRNGAFLILFLGSLFFLFSQATGQVKLRVIVDKANVKATPEIAGRNLASLPLQTILDAESKQGEWYKVSILREGVQISGYIHEMLVEELAEGEVPAAGPMPGLKRTQPEIMAAIELKLEESKSLIRQEKEIERALDELRPLLAKLFGVDDKQKQKQKACEVYLWLGLGYAKKGDHYSAFKEFLSMFEVDFGLAKEITRNIYDPSISNFLDQAEKHYRGMLTEYSLQITTEPKEATIKIDGREIGKSPEVYRTTIPKFVLEIEKRGYRTVREEIFLSQASTRKEYFLESIGRTITISSDPSEAKVYLDGQDTGLQTPCELPYVPFGNRLIRLEKVHYAPREQSIQVLEGSSPLNLNLVLTAKDYVFHQKWGGPGSKFFRFPRAITFDKEGNFYVVDESDIKIKKFDPDGRFQSGWGEAGRESRVLKEPTGVAVDSQGYVYVTDAKNVCVMKFANNGKFVLRWGKQGTGGEDLMNPAAIAIDKEDNLYVADAGSDRIIKYSTLGKVKKTWGKRGMGQGEFVAPVALAITKNNEVIVADRFRFQKFTAEGEFLQAWGKVGIGPGEFSRALGLGTDSHDYLYVADAGNHRLMKFDPNGEFIAQWGNHGVGDGQMATPAGVAVNSKGFVFVVERENNRIQCYRVASQ